MEDIKKIQEFFSKPLEEGKQLDKSDFAKVVKAVEQTGHPVTVLLIPKFNEIEVLTGMDAPDDMLRDLSNAVDSLGYGRNDIIIAGDSSNLSRREYSDIFRVNGGHKDYFEESVNEMDMNDPVLMKMRAAKTKLAKMRAANAGDDGNDKFFDNAKKIAFLKKERAQLMRDMEQEAEPEGGPIADEYGAKLNRIDAAIAKLSGRKEMTYDQAIAENNSYVRVSKPRFIKDKNNPNFLNVYLDYDLGPGGNSIAFGKETMSGQIRRLSSEKARKIAHDIALDLEANFNLEDIEVTDLENGKVRIFAVSDDFIDVDPNMLGEIKESLNPEVSNAVSRFIKAMAKRYDYSEQDAVYAIMAALKQRDFDGLNESTEKDPIDTITMDVPLFIRVLEYAREDAQADMDLHDLAEKAISSTKQQGLLQMDDYDMLVGELEQIGMEENMSLDDQAKAYYLAKVKRGEIDTLPEDPKSAFLAQMTKDQIDHDEETLRRERGLEEKAAYIAETIKLGLMLNEELCEKGQRYIKARQAAGEKSSAYLSGRAVRVCKGQIDWPKKGKKNESLNEAANVEDEMFAAMKNLATSLEKANDNVKPSPKDKKVEEGIITLGATIIGAPGLIAALGKGANYLGKAFGKDKNAVGEFLKKKGHQLEEFYIESLGGWIKAAFPNKYEGQDVKDEKSELHQAAQKAYAAMLTVAAIGAGYEAGAAANVVKAGVEGGMAVLKSSEVIDIIRKLA